ncbi:MAG TPA: 16S rRNA (guanine(527)-N(7))-methyltransferase RsmG [Candidatus Dormibacteraeota bacterium]|nr:16S rRNA (guanine(527)-N(7))-methyltransferase RsmG [Candidatus Dormibacteraeota bacterium]
MSTRDPGGLFGRSPMLREYVRLLDSWPGLVSGPSQPLVEDSLVLFQHLGDAESLIDVGSGGGMPGLPLKIARPELRVTLLEADRRKAAFLVHAAARLDLNVEVVAERAEAAGRSHLREAFDLATCRALAPMPVLAELCLPFVRVGGRLLAMETEVEDATRAIAALGGGAQSVIPAPSSARNRGVVVIVPKISPTPAEYPRRPGVPARRPLR